MTVRRLSAVDAQTYWMSAKIPNDTVLLYGFAGVPADPEAAIEEIAERARGCPDLTVRIEDGGRLTYPAWVHRDVDRSLFVVHDLEGRTFQACLDQVGVAHRRSAGCAGGGVAAARVHRRRGRTRRGGPGHGRGTADLACAWWRRANLGARRDHVRPTRWRRTGNRRPAHGALRPADLGVSCRPGASPDGRRHRGRQGSAAGRSASGTADQCATGGPATPTDCGAAAFRPVRPHRDGRSAVGGIGRAR